MRSALTAAIVLGLVAVPCPGIAQGGDPSPPVEETPIEKMRRLLKEARDTNRQLDQRSGSGPDIAIPEQQDSDPRMREWKQDYNEAKKLWDKASDDGPSRMSNLRDPKDTCWWKVQSYYKDIAEIYRDWKPPRPSRKGVFITRIDFDIYVKDPFGLQTPENIRRLEVHGPVADNFVITQRSGEKAQDQSALAEAQRKARILPFPPQCTSPSLRVYHLFIVTRT